MTIRLSPSGPIIGVEYPPPGGGLLQVPVDGGDVVEVRGENDEDIWYWNATLGLWSVSAPRPIRTWDNAYSPVGNWPLDGNSTASGEHRLTDISGNGFDLALEAGSEQFTMMGYGAQGFLCDGASNLVRTAATPELAITGAMTVMSLIVGSESLPATIVGLLGHAAVGELQADNVLYSILQSATPSRTWFSFQEHGAGVNDGTALQTYITAGSGLHVLGYRKSAPSGGLQSVQLFLDGHNWGAAASITASDGGSSGRFRIGRAGDVAGNFWSGIVGATCIWDQALTNEQILERYNYAVGRVFGYRASFNGPLG